MDKTVLDLTRGSIFKHIITMAMPASIGYFFNTMYNFTDTFWTGIYRQVPDPFLFFNLFAFTFGLGIAGIWWGIVAVNWTAAFVILFHTMRMIKLK